MMPQLVSVSIIGSEGMEHFNPGSTWRRRAGKFYYHDPIEIKSVVPKMADARGGTDIRLQGGPFFPLDTLSCMFRAKVVPAMLVNAQEVSCKTPQHAAGAYSVSVTNNGQEFSGSSSFDFHNVLRVDGINPTSGPSRTAGTNVRVYGMNFVNATSLVCRFGSKVVPAMFSSSSEIHCLSPPIKDSDLSWIDLSTQMHNGTSAENLFPSSHSHPKYLGKLVSFEVSNNGHDFTTAGFSFLYQKDIQVHTLSREGGPSSGETPIFIGGSHFGKNINLTPVLYFEPSYVN
jgi:hypothetical protein